MNIKLFKKPPPKKPKKTPKHVCRDAVFCVSAKFLIFPGWDLVVSHSLTSQCYLS